MAALGSTRTRTYHAPSAHRATSTVSTACSACEECLPGYVASSNGSTACAHAPLVPARLSQAAPHARSALQGLSLHTPTTRRRCGGTSWIPASSARPGYFAAAGLKTRPSGRNAPCNGTFFSFAKFHIQIEVCTCTVDGLVLDNRIVHRVVLVGVSTRIPVTVQAAATFQTSLKFWTIFACPDQ